MTARALRSCRGPCGAAAGFTLSELLISVGILALIGAMLVGLLKSGLDTWNRGEGRRDITERAQIVIGEFLEEFPRIYCEMDARPQASTPKPLEAVQTADEATAPDAPGRPALTCDFDANGNQRLRFTRAGLAELPPIPAESEPDSKSGAKGAKAPPKKPEPVGEEDAPPDYSAWADALRGYSDVAYVLEPVPDQGDRLWRVFLPGPVVGESAFPDGVFGSPEALAENGAVVASGVLYLRYRFWAHTTATWDTRARPSNDPALPGGAEVLWDSTRQRVPEFVFHLPRVSRLGAPVDLLPVMIQVELTMQPDTRRKTWAVVRGNVTSEATEIEVDSTLGFPDAPGMLRIDREWISYKEKTRTRFLVDKRGIRETRAESHKADARALWGESVLTVIPVRNFRTPRDVVVPAVPGKKK